MLGSTILSVFAALSFSLTSVATPLKPRTSELMIRADSVSSVLQSLSGEVNSITPTLAQAITANNTDGITSNLAALGSAFDSATAQIQSVSATDPLGGASINDVAALYAGIIQDVANAVESIVDATGAIGSSLSSLVGSINGLSGALQNLVDGLLDLVGQLLIAVADLLRRLGIALINF